MSAGAITPYRSQIQTRGDGFARLLRAEWTKFRTVRGWLIGMAVAALVTAGIGLLTASGSVCSDMAFSGGKAVSVPCTAPLGPDGEIVADDFYFVHQPLTGNGSIIARVTSLSGAVGSHNPGTAPTPGPLEPWSKAGIIVKESTRQGSAYAAMMVTGGHGVRMQYNFTHDTAGPAGPVTVASPRWLRLTRAGDTLTGYYSPDGTHWTKVGAAHLNGLPATVQTGLFATSPPRTQTTSSLAGTASLGGPTQATAVFDHVTLQGTHPGYAWGGTEVTRSSGPGPLSAGLSGFHQAAGTFTVSGTGDIAPGVGPRDNGMPISHTLVGAFAGLIAVIVVGALFITTEYRRGLIRTTLAASPRRGRVLAAKTVVIGTVSFVAGLAAAAVAVPLGERLLRENGNVIAPVPALTAVRVVVGTAALLAVAAVLALALGALLRHSATAITAVIVAIVLPYIFAVASPVLPTGAADWVLRLTPAAAFAIQQTGVRYPQVDGSYTPFNGYFPLAPWAGFAVLCAYAALALGLAVILLRRRDA